jgi:hypothetical protein
MNDALATRCIDCGHDPSKPRRECECQTCRRLGPDARLGATENDGHPEGYGHGVLKERREVEQATGMRIDDDGIIVRLPPVRVSGSTSNGAR